jgi:cobalt-zinc-cadmium efflux system membrane fusion protein
MLDADTRTVKVRMPFDNRDGRLQARHVCRSHAAGAHTPALWCRCRPSSRTVLPAALRRSQAVAVPARELKLGAQIGEQVEVMSGLKAGERIVVKDGVLLND